MENSNKNYLQTELERLKEFTFIPKRISYLGYRGTKRGSYKIVCLVLRGKEGEHFDWFCVGFSFQPLPDKTKIHAENITEELERTLSIVLRAHAEEILLHPEEWKAGQKSIYKAVPELGTFFIESSPFPMPREYDYFRNTKEEDLYERLPNSIKQLLCIS